jgi:hypothetical protein
VHSGKLAHTCGWLLLLLLQVPTDPPEAGPAYLKVGFFEFGGHSSRSLQMANEGRSKAKMAQEQQQVVQLTGKVRPVTNSWKGRVGACYGVGELLHRLPSSALTNASLRCAAAWRCVPNGIAVCPTAKMAQQQHLVQPTGKVRPVTDSWKSRVGACYGVGELLHRLPSSALTNASLGCSRNDGTGAAAAGVVDGQSATSD